jgi:hypothetical protein
MLHAGAIVDRAELLGVSGKEQHAGLHICFHLSLFLDSKRACLNLVCYFYGIISGDYSHQTSKLSLTFKNMFGTRVLNEFNSRYLHVSSNFSVLLSILNTLLLPSELWVWFYEIWMKVGVSPNTLEDYPH